MTLLRTNIYRCRVRENNVTTSVAKGRLDILQFTNCAFLYHNIYCALFEYGNFMSDFILLFPPHSFCRIQRRLIEKKHGIHCWSLNISRNFNRLRWKGTCRRRLCSGRRRCGGRLGVVRHEHAVVRAQELEVVHCRPPHRAPPALRHPPQLNILTVGTATKRSITQPLCHLT